MSQTDLELLASYARDKAEDAFAEIVQRHLYLVYGAALRQVRSPQLAEEVTQCVFLELARQACRLSTHTILAAWLYKVTHRISLNLVRGEIRRQARERTASEMNALNATHNWKEIEPLLDEGMHSLDETDRAAVLLRYFENKSLREVGRFFGASEDAAQKRVSRAVERLREFFVKRGITIGASSLAIAISANAAQTAPIGLSAAITTAATLGNTIAKTASSTTTTNVIAMTTLKKAVTASFVILLCGTSAVLVSSKFREDSKAGESIAAVNLDQYVGQFEMIDHTIAIEKQASGLAVNIDGKPAFVAYPKTADRFASHDHNSLTEMTFTRDGSGRATGFALVRDGHKLGDLRRTSQ